MKTFNKFTSAAEWLLLALIALFIAFALQARADQQGYPSTFSELTNYPATLANAAVSLAYTNYIPLRSTGLGVQTFFTGLTASATGPVDTFWYPSVDGTNPGTAPFAIQVNTANGTNPICAYTNWSQLQLRGFAGFFVTISNGSGATILLNMTQTNYVTGNTNVNGGLIYNRPNQ